MALRSARSRSCRSASVASSPKRVMQRLQAAGRLVRAAWTGRQVPPFRRKILFEALEQRVFLSADLPGSPGAAAIQPLATTISWVGTANGFWDDAANWRDTSDVARL